MGFINNKNDDNSEFELGSVENYKANSDGSFSHQVLVMKSMSRVIELGGHELASGINETEYDTQRKTTKIIYKEDTREAFVEAIKMAEAVMKCDYDKESITKINDLRELLKPIKKEILKEQWNYWCSLNKMDRAGFVKDNKTPVMKNYLHLKLPFLQEYKDIEIEVYREIFALLVS